MLVLVGYDYFFRKLKYNKIVRCLNIFFIVNVISSQSAYL